MIRIWKNALRVSLSYRLYKNLRLSAINTHMSQRIKPKLRGIHDQTLILESLRDNLPQQLLSANQERVSTKSL